MSSKAEKSHDEPIHEVQKRKFLCAIGKADELFDGEIFGQEPEDSSCHSLHWTDKIATDSVKEIVQEYKKFDIKLYLNCVKEIYVLYSGKGKVTQMIYKALTYVLTHARSFGDSTQNMFQHERNGSFQTEFWHNMIGGQNLLPDSMYMRKVCALINDLQISYDEMKYRILNANVTYLILLILRRFARDGKQFLDAFQCAKTYNDYEKLCPHPLNRQFPRINHDFIQHLSDKRLLKAPVTLAIHAFLTGNDDKTKRILQVTCVQYVEWNGLQMPYLFFKVVSLYGIEEAELWESLGCEGHFKSLFKLADSYYKQYKNSKADPAEMVAWFPYCRALDGNYHRNLSASQNEEVCMILAYLVDLKIGFKKSFARNSHRAKNVNRKDNCLEVAKKICEIYCCNAPFFLPGEEER